MKPIKIIKEKLTIDNDKEHNQVLFNLGLLDDDDDWELYQLQEKRLNLIRDISFKNYLEYIGKTPEEVKMALEEWEIRKRENEEIELRFSPKTGNHF